MRLIRSVYISTLLGLMCRFSVLRCVHRLISPEGAVFASSRVITKSGAAFRHPCRSRHSVHPERPVFKEGSVLFPPLIQISYTARPLNTSRDFLRDSVSKKTSILKGERYMTTYAALRCSKIGAFHLSLASCKKILGVFFLTIFFTAVAYAQELVVDWEAIAQAKEQIAQAKEQIEKLGEQYKELKAQTNAIIGDSGLGDVLKNETFNKDSLPDAWNTVYANIRSKGISGMTDAAQKMYADNKIYDACQHIPDEAKEEKEVCGTLALKGVQDAAFILTLLENANDRKNTISELMDMIKTAKDPKSISQLQARISIEQNAITNDVARLQMFKMAMAAEDAVLQQRQKEVTAKAAARRGNIQLEPLRFDQS
jgi:type IV secretion system protein VirB5